MHFDVHPNTGRAADMAPFLVELPHDRSRVMQTVIVAPLLAFDERDDLGRLTPRVDVEGQAFLISVAELFAIDKRHLRPVVANLESERDRIIAALDFLFTGV